MRDRVRHEADSTPLRSASSSWKPRADTGIAQHYARSSTASSVSDRKRPSLAITNESPDDVPMSRVKFNANTEYAYLQNFKILQSEATYYHG
jgi:hypothetical protein